MSYTPPFTVTSKSINLISEISEKIGILTALSDNPLHVELRKKNRIKTIHSSLAIENNSLSIEQITAIIEGKRVLGAPNEIQEVKNAVQAYELLLELNPYKEEDLLRAHRLMMSDLVDRNGRMGRLWQTVILKEWKSIFAWLPVETIIKERQAEYYIALNSSDTSADSTAFIEFMLTAILDEINNHIDSQGKKVTVKVTAKVTANQKKIIAKLQKNPYMTQKELSEIIGISLKSIKENMKKMQENNILRRVGADKNGYWEITE